MKTIEEIAKELVKRILFAYTDGENLENMCKVAESYLTEQRQIDIDKACEWLLSQNLISRCIVDDVAFVKRFKKALEE